MRYRLTRRLTGKAASDEYFIRLSDGEAMDLQMPELAWLSTAKTPLQFTSRIQYLGEVMEATRESALPEVAAIISALRRAGCEVQEGLLSEGLFCAWTPSMIEAGQEIISFWIGNPKVENSHLVVCPKTPQDALRAFAGRVSPDEALRIAHVLNELEKGAQNGH